MNLARAVLAGAVLALTSTAVFAAVTPSQGTPIPLEHDPAGIVANGTTDAHGSVTFDHLKRGNYVLTIPPVIVAPAHGKPNHLKPRMTILDAHGAQTASAVSFDVCTCAGAKQPTRLHFTIPDDGDGVQLDISDQGASGNLASY
ncbi:MAG TPA: SpaA isopeptide-forming pilin-related protein [Rhizomicrobium sp.]|nr:SpaA isopeptide-forming pilin-related protein [Rhizomicrobium sp.]